MADQDRYTAEQLAQLAGVSLRTVRYYVQEELIDRPLARGPGAHFTEKHLAQLKRCKLLQDWGFDLETIRDRSASFQGILEGFPIDTHVGRDGALLREMFRAIEGEPGGAFTPKQAADIRAMVQRMRGQPAKPASPAGREVIPMADGVDLVVDRSAYDVPSPKALVDIALLVRKAFDPMKKRDDEE